MDPALGSPNLGTVGLGLFDDASASRDTTSIPAPTARFVRERAHIYHYEGRHA